MKKLIILNCIAFSALLFFSGCIAIGNDVPKNGGGTIGQQLIDLQKAKSHGAITEAEYQILRKNALDNK